MGPLPVASLNTSGGRLLTFAFTVADRPGQVKFRKTAARPSAAAQYQRADTLSGWLRTWPQGPGGAVAWLRSLPAGFSADAQIGVHQPAPPSLVRRPWAPRDPSSSGEGNIDAVLTDHRVVT